MSAYYNEIDPYAAQWLRNLIAAGQIAPGDVDERSIVGVQPDDLRGYTQCHFFAGIGGWSIALRMAMWPDDRPVWTGSCPCQPFSAAGKKKGHSDERHLWPHWFRLIRECRPTKIFGEQVAGAVAFGWLDDVCGDLETKEYAVAAAVLPAYSATAPHGRDRIYLVADADIDGDRREEHAIPAEAFAMARIARAENYCSRLPGRAAGVESGDSHQDHPTSSNAIHLGQQGVVQGALRGQSIEPWQSARGFEEFNGGWPVHSPKLRTVDDGLPYAASQIRAYGNAIVPQVAAEFIKAYMECA